MAATLSSPVTLIGRSVTFEREGRICSGFVQAITAYPYCDRDDPRPYAYIVDIDDEWNVTEYVALDDLTPAQQLAWSASAEFADLLDMVEVEWFDGAVVATIIATSQYFVKVEDEHDAVWIGRDYILAAWTQFEQAG